MGRATRERVIYLDYNASTPVDPLVAEEMLPWLTEAFWNPASAHVLGRQAAAAVDHARAELAALVGASPSELVFTSGATEANNLALQGAWHSRPAGRDRIVVTATEHKSVLDVAAALEEEGAKVDVAPVRRDGVVDLEALTATVSHDVAIVSVMLANNETGVVNPVHEVARVAHAVGALVHSDVTQGFGKVPVDVHELDVDLASFSAHKLYGPKGIGALFARRSVALSAQIHGGGHERGLRAGTLNVPAIVGFAAAARLASAQLEAEALRQRSLIECLKSELRSRLADVQIPAEGTGAAGILPNTLNVRIVGADADAVLAGAPTVACSSGSACSSRVPGPSHVLVAMLGEPTAASECIRFSVGRMTTPDDVREAAREIATSAARVLGLMQ